MTQVRQTRELSHLPLELANPNRRQFLLTAGSVVPSGVIAAYNAADAASWTLPYLE